MKFSRHQRFVFLNFGPPYPSQTISAFIPSSVTGRLLAVASVGGKRARVTGLIGCRMGSGPP